MKAVFIGILFWSLSAGADCIPQNMYYIGANTIPSLIGETEFISAIKEVEDAYQPDVKKLGGVLQINNLWLNGTVNAQAYKKRKGNLAYFMVDAFGGLARYPGMTRDAYIAVLCHEVGHHLGGAPKYGWPMSDMSNEGQADYFATLKCLKRLNIAAADPSLALASVLADLGGDDVPSRSARDKRQVKRTANSHPEAQCRLDTYDAGDACSVSGAQSNKDPKPGTCHKYNRSKNPVGAGNRPRCWFYPR